MDDLLVRFDELLDNMLEVDLTNNASMQVKGIIFDELISHVGHTNATELIGYLDIDINQEIYDENKKYIDKMAVKMAKIVYNCWSANVNRFGRDAADVMLRKQDLSFYIKY